MGKERSRSLDERAQLVNLWLDEVPPVRWLADKSTLGIQPLAVAFAGFFWMVLFALWGFMGELVCKVVGNLYPMYASFRALEDGDHQQVSSWLTYWVSFAALTLLEGVWCRFMAWLPFYYVLRLALIVWLFLPVTGGAQALTEALGRASRQNGEEGKASWYTRSALRLRGPGGVEMDATELLGGIKALSPVGNTRKGTTTETVGQHARTDGFAQAPKCCIPDFFIFPRRDAERSQLLDPRVSSEDLTLPGNITYPRKTGGEEESAKPLTEPTQEDHSDRLARVKRTPTITGSSKGDAERSQLLDPRVSSEVELLLDTENLPQESLAQPKEAECPA
ncbi:Receptor expression-enhancing protein 2, partial [Symbiodinium microadriaticum]